jgi:hypothetical protein
MDSLLEQAGFEPVWGFLCQVVILVFSRFFVRSGKAVLRPVACDQVPAARARGQGTETLAKLGGLPPSDACVSQRLRLSTRRDDEREVGLSMKLSVWLPVRI